MVRYLLLILLLFSKLHLSAQIFDFEQSKPTIRWHQLQTPHIKLIFPASFDNLAPQLLQQLDRARLYSSVDLHRQVRRYPIVIQNMSVEANGFVQLAPRKSELFSTPSGTPDNQAWLSNLAIHEWRHIAQMQQLTKGLSKPFFEQLALAWWGISLPAWYFEGDAVYQETIFSQGGRGRLPSWEMPIRANELSRKNYSYDQYILGSYKHNIPSYYSIGYLMNASLHADFGSLVSQELLDNMRANPLRPYNFRYAFKKITRKTPKNYFQQIITDLNSQWTQQEAKQNHTNYQPISEQKQTFPTNYLLPKQLDATHTVVLKQGHQFLPQLVALSANKEQNLVYTGTQIHPHYDLKDSLLTWDEYRVDKRYRKNSYSLINTYNMKTGRVKQLTKNSRYYSPVFHPWKMEIAVVKVSLNNQASLVILDQHTGAELQEVAMPMGLHIQHPQFHPSGKKLVAIGITEAGTQLLEISLTDSLLSPLGEISNQQYERPSYFKEDIIFKAHFNGRDNIYRWQQADKRIVQLTEARFGAFNPSIDSLSKRLFFNDYQASGHLAASVSLDSVGNTPIEELQDLFTHYYRAGLAASTPAAPILKIQTKDSLEIPEITAYKGLGRTFNFHSLTISSNQFDNFDNYKPGLFWLSNNVLNTTQAILGVEHDTDLNKTTYSAELAYQKYFPKITLRYENRGQQSAARLQSNRDSLVQFDWREHLATAQVSLPLNFYKQRYSYSTGLNIASSYLKRYDISRRLSNFTTEIAFPLTYQFYFNRLSRLAHLDLAPNWGQQLSVTYRHLPFSERLKGAIFSVRTNLYFPGIVKQHSFQLRASYQEGSDTYQYTQDIPMVSAYGFFTSGKIRNTILLNYRFPLLYPDLAIGGLAFVKRIKAGIFADYQNIEQEKQLAPKTFGLSISADLNMLRYTLPDVDLSYKFTYINDASATQRVVPSFSISYTY